MKDMQRFANFSDAVMAIAITLLILPLTERAANARITSFHAFGAAFGHLLLVFLLSFVVIYRYWEVHHDLMRSVQTFDAKLFWCNGLWLLSIAIIPFTSELIGNNATNSVFINGIYIASLMITGYAGYAMQFTASHSPHLRRPGAAALPVSYGLYSAVAMTLALLIAIAVPSIGIWSLVLLIPAGYIRRIVRRSSTPKAS